MYSNLPPDLLMRRFNYFFEQMKELEAFRTPIFTEFAICMKQRKKLIAGITLLTSLLFDI